MLSSVIYFSQKYYFFNSFKKNVGGEVFKVPKVLEVPKVPRVLKLRTPNFELPLLLISFYAE